MILKHWARNMVLKKVYSIEEISRNFFRSKFLLSLLFISFLYSAFSHNLTKIYKIKIDIIFNKGQLKT